jgi:hypothetical protein
LSTSSNTMTITMTLTAASGGTIRRTDSWNGTGARWLVGARGGPSSTWVAGSAAGPGPA